MRKRNPHSEESAEDSVRSECALYEAIAGDGVVVGRGDTAQQALDQARAKGYGAQDVVIQQVGTGDLLST